MRTAVRTAVQGLTGGSSDTVRSWFDGENAAATNPTIVAGRIFVGSASGRVYALGLNDGCEHWTFKADGGVRSAVTVGDASAGHLSAFFGVPFP